jgi:hypothetical protein
VESQFSADRIEPALNVCVGRNTNVENLTMARIGYVLLTNGAKHTSVRLAKRPGAKAQIDLIEGFAERGRREIGKWIFDHARSPKGPGSYPALFTWLAYAKEHDATGLIILDDVMRLYRRLPVDAVIVMLKALEPFHQYIIDARQRKLLSELGNADWLALLRSNLRTATPAREKAASPTPAKPEATARARLVSQRARGRAADHHARLIFELRDELAAEGRAPSNVALAKVANERGLKTSRGGPWSNGTVGRALKRLEADGSADC